MVNVFKAVVFHEKNCRNSCVFYDGKFNVFDIWISMCLLWMEFVILRVLKRTLFHVTDHGAWLSNLYLLGSPLLLFDRDLAKLSRSYKWLAGDVAFSCWFGRYVAWRWRRCCQAETWPDVVNFLYCNDCSALLSNVIITEFIYVEAEKCWIIRFSRFSCFKKA